MLRQLTSQGIQHQQKYFIPYQFMAERTYQLRIQVLILHIQDLDQIFMEFKRVLKPKGLMIHTLPSGSCRFWTILGHYLYILKYLMFGKQKIHGVEEAPSINKYIGKKGVTSLIKRAFFPGPHGAYPNAISEIYYFSRYRWTRVFQKSGFKINKYQPNNLFYSQYGIFPGLQIKMRQKLSKLLGSSSHIFVLETGRLVK
jgi:hypothetical protein